MLIDYIKNNYYLNLVFSQLMKHFYEKESQCSSKEGKDIVLERRTDGEVKELVVMDEEGESDADND